MLVRSLFLVLLRLFPADSQLLKPTPPWSPANLTARRQELDVICECVFNITGSHAAGRNLVFVSDQIRTDLSHWLLRRADRSSKIISSAIDIARNVGFFLFVQETAETSYVEMLARMPPNDVMRFVVVFDFQDKIVLRRVQTVLEEFWLHRIIDVVVLVPFRVSKNVRVYTYQPYSPTRCAETGPPVLINVWNSASKAFLNRGDLFSRTKKVSTALHIIRPCWKYRQLL